METIRFPSRDLKPYADYMDAAQLVEGETYFLVHYLDTGLRIPELTALVFIGRNLESGDVNRLYFQDAASFLAGARYAIANEIEARIDVVDADTPFVYEFERALDSLLKCSLERRKSV